jgi:peptidoglycan/LPS O-acetylase OafA/YrhL
LSKRFYRPELDVIRFVGFLCVFIHHSMARVPLVPGKPSVMVAVANAFAFGLCLFFVLSAYLIATLLMREKDQTGTIALPQFYTRRILRIWPLYFLALLGAMAWSAHLGEFHADRTWFLAAFLMSANFVPWPDTIVQHLWSISIEEQFYVILPGFVRKASRRGLLIFAVAMIVAANAVLAYFGIIHADTDQRVWSNTIVQFEMFAGGILLALHHYGRETIFKSMGQRILAAGFLPVAWFLAAYVFRIKGIWQPALGPVSLCVGYALVALSCCLLITSVMGLHKWPQWTIFMGKVSYGLYVFHKPVIYFVAQYGNFVPKIFVKIIELAITSLLAWLSYRFFETPFLRLKGRFEIVKSRPVNDSELKEKSVEIGA